MSREFVSLAEDQIERLQKRLFGFEEQIDKVKARAINRSASTAQSTLVKEIRQRYNVKAKDVRSTVTIRRAKPSSPQAEIRSNGSVLPATSFKINPRTVNGKRRTPIRISYKRGSTKTLEDAFIARLNTGHLGVFKRLGKERFPIQKQFGPSVPQMAGNDQVVESVIESANEMLDKRLDHEINRILSGSR